LSGKDQFLLYKRVLAFERTLPGKGQAMNKETQRLGEKLRKEVGKKKVGEGGWADK